MKRQTLTAQRWIPCALVLVLLLGSGLVGCKSTPPAPETVPSGPAITVKSGETIAIHASAEGADRYEWGFQGEGEVSSLQEPAILYTAPNEGGKALLSVTAHNSRGASPPTSLTINVSQPPIPLGPIAIKPVQDTTLVDKDCPISGAQGEVQAQGTIDLSGLEPDQTYRLTLNGWSGVPPNDELCKIDCTSHGEGFWDFDTQVTADANGEVSQRRLEAALPAGVELYPDTTYKVKFFVKEGAPRFCTVLGHDEFRFTVESLQ
jgi:hypothetical protein